MTPEGWEQRSVHELLAAFTTGVSVNSEGRPSGPNELGILKTSAVTYGVFRPGENKAVLPSEVGRVRENPKSGCVLVSRMNTPALVGASAFVDRDWPHLFLPDRIWQLQPRNTLADGRWLFHLLSAPKTRSALGELASGTSGSMKNLSQQKFASLVLPTPPLGEQKKIAAILSSVDEAIEATQAVIDQLQVVKKAMMAELLTRGLPGKHTRLKQSAFGLIPEEWETASLGDITDRVRRAVNVESDMHYRGIGVRSHGKGVFHKEPVLGQTLGSKRVFHVEPGCLIVNIVFAWEGAVAATTTSDAGTIVSHRFPLLRPKRDVASLHYLRLLLQTRRGTELLASLSPGGAGRNKTLNQEAYLRLEVPVPPIEEQESLARAITSIESRLLAEQRKRDAARAAKTALMPVLLTGEVRVKPDDVCGAKNGA